MQEPTRSREQHQSNDSLSSAAAAKQKHEDEPKQTERNTYNPAKKLYRWLKGHHFQIIKLPTHDKLNLLFTLIIAVATTAYVIVTKRQLDEMRASGIESERQIKQLIEQAGKQASNTHDVAIAAQRQSEQAEAQTKKMGESLARTDKLISATNDLAKQSKRSADASQFAIDAARKNLALAEQSLHVQERPYIGVKRTTVSGLDTGDFKASVEMANAGKTPALGFQFRVFIVLTTYPLPDNPPEPQLASVGSVSILLGSESVQTGDVHIDTRDEFADINAGKLFVYVFGRMSYNDVFKCRHEGRFCSVYLPKIKNFTACPNNNFEVEEVCK